MTRRTNEELAAARALCAACPVTADCLEHALVFHEVGFWGGTNETERATIRRGYRREGTTMRTREQLDSGWRAAARCRGVDTHLFVRRSLPVAS